MTYSDYYGLTYDTDLSIVRPEWYKDTEIVGYLKTTNNWNKIKRLYAIYNHLLKIYDNRVDFICIGKDEFYVVIYYPQITITNVEGEKHIMYDLYFLLNTDLEAKGCRTTYSLAEYRVSYIHSHLPSSSSFDINKFCMGSSPLKLRLMDLRSKYNGITFEEIELLAFTIDTYLQLLLCHYQI